MLIQLYITVTFFFFFFFSFVGVCRVKVTVCNSFFLNRWGVLD